MHQVLNAASDRNLQIQKHSPKESV